MQESLFTEMRRAQVFIGAQGDAAKKVEQEARLLTDLKHVHILRALESFMAGGVFNIVTDFCDDGDLSVAIEKQRGPNGDGLPPILLLSFGIELGTRHQPRVLVGRSEVSRIPGP